MSPAEPTGACGAPFFAINGHLRQENDYGAAMTMQTAGSGAAAAAICSDRHAILQTA